jgi:hypothetical protein
MLKLLILALCSAWATAIQVKMYAEDAGGAKFSVRCVDGSQPQMGDLDYIIADATISMNENTNGFRSASDCEKCEWGMCNCENCWTNCGKHPNFAAHQSICTDDDSAVLCTGSSCGGGLRAIGKAQCNGAMEIQVESSTVIVNIPTSSWVWVSRKASDDTIAVTDITGWVLSSGREFKIGGGALVMGQGEEERVGKCCDENGVTVFGNPPGCDTGTNTDNGPDPGLNNNTGSDPGSGGGRPHGDAFAKIVFAMVFGLVVLGEGFRG